MDDALELEVNWGDRAQSVDQCAHLATRFLQKLAEFDDAFNDWRVRGTSRADALANPIAIAETEIHNRLQREFERRQQEIPGWDHPTLSLSLWNGREGDGALGLLIACGAVSFDFIRAENQCRITLPYEDGPTTTRLRRRDALLRLFELVVYHWNPDRGSLLNFTIWNSVHGELGGSRFAGWFTYLSDRCGAVPELPEAYSVQRIGNLGSLIRVKGADSWTSTNPSHFSAAKELTILLRASGLLLSKSP